MSVKEENIRKALQNIGDRLVREARINLDKSRKKDTGSLRKSLDYEILDSSDKIEVALIAADYAKYIDKGRGPSRGAGKESGGALRRSLEGWVRRNRYRLKGRRGEFGALKDYQVKSLAFIISQKIHNVGFVGVEFISDAFKTTEQYITNTLSESYKKDIQKEIERILNQ